MSSLRPATVAILVRQDLGFALKSTRGLLFLVFFGVFWFWVLWKLSSGAAQMLANPEGTMVLSWLFDPELARTLFADRAPTLSVFYLLSMGTVPMFVLVAASDQTANDIGSKFLRFLTPRCNRLEVYIARFLGSVILVSVSYLLVTLAAALVSASVDANNTADVIAYAMHISLSLVIYVIPFVALMSFCSASVGSAGLSALIGLSCYVLVLALVNFVGIKWPEVGEFLRLLLPSVNKAMFLELEWGSLLGASLAVPVYVLAYGGMGWLVFSRRDI